MSECTNNGRYQKYHGSRGLLNRAGHQTTAAIVAEIEDSSTWKGAALSDKWSSPRCTLQFSDCDRSISYSIAIEGTADEFDNNLYKVTTMIDALQSFRRAMKLERERLGWRRQAHGHSVEH